MHPPDIFNVWQKLEPIKQYLDFNTKYFDFMCLRKNTIHNTPQEILAEREDDLNFEIMWSYNLFADAESLFVHLFLLSQLA